MQKAELVLAMLNQTSKKDRTFKFQRVYRNLFNPDFYLYAYSRIYNNEGNMTEGTDKKTIDGFNKNWIDDIIEQLKYEKYTPASVRRVYIPKKNGKMRPLGIPSFKDKLIQEVIREILEAIYEPIFLDNSHGFRPDRSCQTALYQIKRNGTGTSWIIEGDIKSFFDTINHEILLSILKQKIDDNRFIELIRRLLKSGYVSDGITYNTITGTPQGGIVSPILANIYLHDFDLYMEKLIQEYTKGKERRPNKEYKSLRDKCYYRRKIDNMKENDEFFKQLSRMPSKDPLDPNFVRVRYYRYADDFVVLIIGSLETAEQIREKIREYLKEKLQLELNMDKTLITNILTDKARFLGYEINKAKDDSHMIRDSMGRKKRCINGTIQLSVPVKVIGAKIKEFTRNGKPFHRNDRINLPVFRILNKYNAEMRGLYNFYRMAYNVGNLLHKFKYYHYFSLLNTICNKENISIMKLLDKYGITVKRKLGTGSKRIFGIRYETKKVTKVLTYFDNPIIRIDKPLNYDVDFDAGNISGKPYCELIVRLNKSECELCQKKIEEKEIVVHHVRNLTAELEKYENNKSPKWLKVMEKMRRKTLVVCCNCHDEIHKGL
ncbi:MAG TPA: group II intron reverse transcriptase/maturase [Methanosarcina sp.]|nr:group II intron reverse transcriptase/maturase [Methanosarcina sp.]